MSKAAASAPLLAQEVPSRSRILTETRVGRFPLHFGPAPRPLLFDIRRLPAVALSKEGSAFGCLKEQSSHAGAFYRVSGPIAFTRSTLALP